MPASVTVGGVSKSGSPISRWMMWRPSRSRARARASTSNAVSVPSRSMRLASSISHSFAPRHIHHKRSISLDKGVIWGVKLRSWGVIVSLTLVVAGCGRSAAKATLPPTPIPRPTPTPTVSLAFQVGVTDVPLKKHRPKAKPSPLPSPPPGPYIRIFPNAGSPVPHPVHVYGAHLPHDAALQLVWSSQNVLSSVTAPAHTDTRGRLQAVFHVPAASPGPYRVVAEFGGSPLTSAPFTVRSSA